MAFEMGSTSVNSAKIANATRIGEAAGEVWKRLNSGGTMSRTQLARETGLSADLTSLAVGWLAREDKLLFEPNRKGEELLRLKK